MSRDSSTYKESYNRALNLIGEIGTRGELPTESELSVKWDVSRTTVRTILKTLQDVGIIQWSGRSKKILRKARDTEYFPEEETTSHSDRLSSIFMEYILTGELAPGAILRESELAKQFNVSSTIIREFLIHFARFGLIEKTPNRHWVLNGFTREFSDELFAVREMFEHKAFRSFLAAGSKKHQKLISLKAEHLKILENIEQDYMLFPRLDEKFHLVWVKELNNRFVHDFFDLISLVFHYHYRWNKNDEMGRNRDAANQHLDIILAVEAGDFEAADAYFLTHLQHAKETLAASAQWDPIK